MKRPGLTPPLLAATLFLAAGMRAEETKPATPPAAAPKSAANPMRGGRRDAELLKRFDKNGDGKLDDDERAEAKDAMMKENFDKQAARAALLGGTEQERAKMLEMFDKNKDGKLDDEERAAAEKFGRERAEAAKAAPSAPPPGAPGGGFNLRAELIRRLDKNGDGKIDEVERTDGVAFVTANLNQFPGLKQRFDKNGDGKLDNEEQVALDEGLRQLAQGAPGPGGRGPMGATPTLESLPPPLREQALKRFDKDGDGKLNTDELAALQAEMSRRREERMAKGGPAPGAARPMAAGTATREEPPVTDKEEAEKLNKAFEDFAPKLDVTKPAQPPTK